jgi:hypothetical protein
METVCTSESLVSIYKQTRSYNPEEHRQRRHEKLRSHMKNCAHQTVFFYMNHLHKFLKPTWKASGKKSVMYQKKVPQSQICSRIWLSQTLIQKLRRFKSYKIVNSKSICHLWNNTVDIKAKWTRTVTFYERRLFMYLFTQLNVSNFCCAAQTKSSRWWFKVMNKWVP